MCVFFNKYDMIYKMYYISYINFMQSNVDCIAWMRGAVQVKWIIIIIGVVILNYILYGVHINNKYKYQ